MRARVVVSVSTSRSRDGLETYFSNVSVSSRQSVRSRSRSPLGLKAKRLGLVSVSGHNVSFTSGHLNNFFQFLSFSYKTNMTVIVQLDCICLMMIRLQLCDRLLCSSSLHRAARQTVRIFNQLVRPYNETNQISSVTKQAGKACVS